MSAACILERYIEDQGEGAIPAMPYRFPPSNEQSTFDYDIIRRHIRDLHYNGQGDRTVVSATVGNRAPATRSNALCSNEASSSLQTSPKEALSESERLAIAQRDSQRRNKGTLKRRSSLK